MDKETECISIYDMWGRFKGYKTIKTNKLNKAHGTNSSTDCNN
jgi:hypothetical protein